MTSEAYTKDPVYKSALRPNASGASHFIAGNEFDPPGVENSKRPGTSSEVARETVKKMLVGSPLPQLDSIPQSDELAAEVIEACRCGDRQGLNSFVRCYERRVFAYLLRPLGNDYPIEDLAQDAFVRAYPARARFEIKGSAKLSTWLLSIAHRVAVDARRHRQNAG